MFPRLWFPNWDQSHPFLAYDHLDSVSGKEKLGPEAVRWGGVGPSSLPMGLQDHHSLDQLPADSLTNVRDPLFFLHPFPSLPSLLKPLPPAPCSRGSPSLSSTSSHASSALLLLPAPSSCAPPPSCSHPSHRCSLGAACPRPRPTSAPQLQAFGAGTLAAPRGDPPPPASRSRCPAYLHPRHRWEPAVAAGASWPQIKGQPGHSPAPSRGGRAAPRAPGLGSLLQPRPPRPGRAQARAAPAGCRLTGARAAPWGFLRSWYRWGGPESKFLGSVGRCGGSS